MDATITDDCKRETVWSFRGRIWHQSPYRVASIPTNYNLFSSEQ